MVNLIGQHPVIQVKQMYHLAYHPCHCREVEYRPAVPMSIRRQSRKCTFVKRMRSVGWDFWFVIPIAVLKNAYFSRTIGNLVEPSFLQSSPLSPQHVAFIRYSIHGMAKQKSSTMHNILPQYAEFRLICHDGSIRSPVSHRVQTVERWRLDSGIPVVLHDHICYLVISIRIHMVATDAVSQYNVSQELWIFVRTQRKGLLSDIHCILDTRIAEWRREHERLRYQRLGLEHRCGVACGGCATSLCRVFHAGNRHGLQTTDGRSGDHGTRTATTTNGHCSRHDGY